MGLGNQSESWKIIILSLKFTKREYIIAGVPGEKPYSQTKWSVPLKIALMNWLFETWTR